jgi:putative tryptophan/tyrosine transport system substrate-binding protein
MISASLVLILALLAVPVAAEAQQAARIYRLGFLVSGSPPAPSDQKTTATLLATALRELDYVEGRNLVIERRYARGQLDRLPGLVRELVRLRMDVIVAIGSAAIRAAKDATSTIPIVMYGNFDPVAIGLVASLAQPGGNVTGVVIAPGGTLAGKKLELLKEAVPRAARIVFLAPDDPNVQPQVLELQRAASSLGVQLTIMVARDGDYDRAFATIAADRPGALFVAAHNYFMRDRKQIIELAGKHRLPAIYESSEQVEEGGLMSYGGSLSRQVRRLAAYVHRILGGTKPADLPVEQPTTFELVINLKTAKALGLTIPPSLLLRAEQIIE